MKMDESRIRFGPAGIPDGFYKQGNDSSIEMPIWLNRMGLDAFEYQCGRGVRIKEPMAIRLHEAATENDIFMSVHAPYYINLANEDQSKREKSLDYIMQAAVAASWIGADRIVVHLGSCSTVSRKKAMELVAQEIRNVIALLKDRGLYHIHICPETMGKINQFGTLEEIVEICRIDESLIPAVDFGHLYARGKGALNSTEAFDEIMGQIENALGKERLKVLHCHFSKVEFTNGGEKRHVMLQDADFGPDFEKLAAVIASRVMTPVIICESHEDMAEQALILKRMYLKALAGE